MKTPVYFDYAATTPVDPRVAQKMSECLLAEGKFGNQASRSHKFGWEAEEAVAFIEKHKDQPFFLNMDNYAVHTPIQAKPSVTAKYEAKPKTAQKNARYAAMVESVDDCAGHIMDALRKHGIANRTVILFTSDKEYCS